MTVSEEEFQALLAEAMDELPAFFKQRMSNVYVEVEEFPGRDVLRAQGVDNPFGLLGLYQGYPLKKRGYHYTNVLPDRITIYRGPIARLSRSRVDLKRRVKAVFVHELAHHFGFTEEELARLEDV